MIPARTLELAMQLQAELLAANAAHEEEVRLLRDQVFQLRTSNAELTDRLVDALKQRAALPAGAHA